MAEIVTTPRYLSNSAISDMGTATDTGIMGISGTSGQMTLTATLIATIEAAIIMIGIMTVMVAMAGTATKTAASAAKTFLSLGSSAMTTLTGTVGSVATYTPLFGAAYFTNVEADLNSYLDV